MPRRREHGELDADRRRRRGAHFARTAGHSAAGRGLRPRRSAARGLRQSVARTDHGRHAAQRGQRHLCLRLRVVADALRSAAAGGRQTAWRNFARRRRARFATCGVTPRTCLPPLAAAISACVQREPSRRPDSMARLAAMLGSPTRSGKEALADCLARAGRPTVRWTTTVRKVRRSNRTPLWLAGAACLLAAMVAIFWPAWARSARSSGRWLQVASGSSGAANHDNPCNPPYPNHLSAFRPPPSASLLPWFRRRTSSRCSRRKIWCFRPANRAAGVAGVSGRPMCPRPLGPSGGGARSGRWPGRRQGKRPFREHRLRMGSCLAAAIRPRANSRRWCNCEPAGRNVSRLFVPMWR